jgi:hypothetical protein
MTDTHPHHPLEDYLPADTVEHLRAARAEMRQSLETLLPPGFLAHRRAARREMLLAARSFIDAALRRSEPPTGAA